MSDRRGPYAGVVSVDVDVRLGLAQDAVAQVLLDVDRMLRPLRDAGVRARATFYCASGSADRTHLLAQGYTRKYPWLSVVGP